jgi:uncharacterized protein (DUF2342 family)
VLALVEGWVSTVVDEVAATRLPQASALAGRSGGAGPPAGGRADLRHPGRPRAAAAPPREAAAIWRGLTDERGVSGRDAVWAHPDLLPGPDDFDDPDGFVRGRSPSWISPTWTSRA